MFDTITRFVRNVWLTHLHTLLDSNGHIRSGQVKEDLVEGLRRRSYALESMEKLNATGKSRVSRKRSLKML